MRVHWPALAITSLLAGALLLLRAQPLPAYGCLLILLAWPWLKNARATLLLATLLSCWMAWSYQQQWQSRLLQPPLNTRLQGQVEGAVSSRDGARHFAFRVQAPGQDLNGHLLRVAWYRDAPDVRSGDCWQLQLRLRPAHGFSNPGGMDYEAWLFREGYAGKASVRQGQLCGRAVPSLRQTLKDGLLHGRSDAAAATVSALLLGDRSDLSTQDWRVLRRTGTSHLFAISGLHVGLVAALGWGLGVLLWRFWLYRILPRQRDVAVLLAALFALTYAALSGFAVPVQRALVMCLLGLLALQLGRQQQGLSVLALAWVLVVAINPLSLMMPGLWLSFTAVAGILIYLQRYPAQARWKQLIGIQVLLSVLLLPLSLLFFGGVSLLAAPVNLALVPLFSVLLPALMLAALTSLLGWAGPMQWALQALELMWQGLEKLSQAPQAFASYSVSAWWLAGLATLAIFLGLRGNWRGRVLAAICVAVCLLWRVPSPAQGQLRAWFWDVGQGQSVLLQTAHHQLLYDAGPAWPGGFDAGERLLLPALQQQGIDKLDVLLISHADKDHAGGAVAVAAAMNPIQRRGFGGLACHAGQYWLWDDVRFEILHPDAANWSDNSGSCVLQVSTPNGQRLLLTGDIEKDAERALLDDAKLAQQTVISVPHHGSSSSSSAAFLNRLKPRWGVVSAGFYNRWGHPADAVAQRYQAHGIELLNTAEHGAIRMDFGATVTVQSWRDSHARLWRTFAPQSAP